MSASSFKLPLKLLMRRKGYTAISLFGIAMTLVVLVVVAAIIDGVIGSGGAQPHAGRTLVVMQARQAEENNSSSGPIGWGLAERTIRDLPGAEEVSLCTNDQEVDAWAGDREIPLRVRFTDAAFWRIHRFRFVEGGPLTEDDVEQARPVVVLGRSAARAAFGDGPALGRSLEIGRSTKRVVGVIEDVSGLRFVAFAEAYIPLTLAAGVKETGIHGPLMASIVARGKGDLPRIRREFAARVAAVPLEPGQTLVAHAESMESAVARMILPPGEGGVARVGALRATLAVLACAFLALPVLNLVNLSLSRMLERSTEIGVRKAFGATPARLAGQLVAENVVLVLAGAVVTLAVAPLVLRAVDASGIMEDSQLELSMTVLAWGVGMALAFGVLSGAWPAWRMARWHPVHALRGRTP